MKFLNYLIKHAPAEAKISMTSGFGGSIIGLYNFLTDDRFLKLVTALCTLGALVTMLLTWTFWIIKIRKEGKGNG